MPNDFEIHEMKYGPKLVFAGAFVAGDVRAALVKAVEKWRTIAEWIADHRHRNCTLEDGGVKTCPLCHLFSIHDDHGHFEGCKEGCPVYQRSGVQRCRGTPYEDYAWAQTVFDALDAAWCEVGFLESLLKEYDLCHQ